MAGVRRDDKPHAHSSVTCPRGEVVPVPRPLGELSSQPSLSWAALLLALGTHSVSAPLAAGQGFSCQSLGSLERDSGRRQERPRESSRCSVPAESVLVASRSLAQRSCAHLLPQSLEKSTTWEGHAELSVRPPPPASAPGPPRGLAQQHQTGLLRQVSSSTSFRKRPRTQCPPIKQGNCWEVLTRLQNHVLGKR